MFPGIYHQLMLLELIDSGIWWSMRLVAYFALIIRVGKVYLTKDDLLMYDVKNIVFVVSEHLM